MVGCRNNKLIYNDVANYLCDDVDDDDDDIGADDHSKSKHWNKNKVNTKKLIKVRVIRRIFYYYYYYNHKKNSNKKLKIYKILNFLFPLLIW